MGFEIGKEVVAIESHSQGIFKKGDIFTVDGLKSGCCLAFVINVGIKLKPNQRASCGVCGKWIDEQGSWAWFDPTMFRPLDDISISELTEHLETTEPFKI